MESFVCVISTLFTYSRAAVAVPPLRQRLQRSQMTRCAHSALHELQCRGAKTAASSEAEHVTLL